MKGKVFKVSKNATFPSVWQPLKGDSGRLKLIAVADLGRIPRARSGATAGKDGWVRQPA
jgi:hypothetical protein